MRAPEPPFGVSEYSTWPLTFAQDLELYRRCGIAEIEVCEAKLDAVDPHPQLERLKGLGFQVSSVQPRVHSLFPDGPRPKPADPHERMACLARTIAVFGRHFPGTTLVTITGAAAREDYAAAYATAAREYGEIARAAADHGVRVAVEPLNPVLMNSDTFICSLAHARRIIDAVNHPSFGIFLDVWHFWEDAAAPAEIARFAGRIFGVHVNDWRTPRAFADRCLPGEGEIPFRLLLPAIRDAGYRGTYTLEVFSDLKLPGSLWSDPERTILDGRKGFQKVWEEACG